LLGSQHERIRFKNRRALAVDPDLGPILADYEAHNEHPNADAYVFAFGPGEASTLVMDHMHPNPDPAALREADGSPTWTLVAEDRSGARVFHANSSGQVLHYFPGREVWVMTSGEDTGRVRDTIARLGPPPAVLTFGPDVIGEVQLRSTPLANIGVATLSLQLRAGGGGRALSVAEYFEESTAEQMEHSAEPLLAILNAKGVGESSVQRRGKFLTFTVGARELMGSF
jgi:hypothetical protein